MYNDTELASTYEWNSNRRGGVGSPKPKAKLHDRQFSCSLQTTETYEEKDCYGHPHIDWKKPGATDMMEILISKWIDIK